MDSGFIGIIGWYAIKFAAVAAVAYGGLWVRRTVQRSRQAKALGWASIEGMIVSAKAAEVKNTPFYLATLTYSYFVEEYRAGEFTHEFSREDDADEFVRSMRDRRLPIRYNQSRPDESVIDQSVIDQYLQIPLRQ